MKNISKQVKKKEISQIYMEVMVSAVVFRQVLRGIVFTGKVLP